MNNKKLVDMIKTLVTEANRHHSMRYNYGVKKASRSKLHIPNKTPQLAEKKIEKIKRGLKPGKTDTGQMANHINTEPAYNSQMTAASGPKPQIDTK